MVAEWRKCRWGDLATLEYGKALRGYDQAKATYPVYGTNGPIGWHTESLYNEPSVIIGRKGAYRGTHYSKTPFYVIDTAFYLKPKVTLDTRWAYYELLLHDINHLDSGSAIPSTSREDFYSLPVLLPPVPEQRAIARVLGTLDDKIELNQRITASLEAMAQAIFKSWFVDFDPVRAKADGRQAAGLDADTVAQWPDRLEESELGEIPLGWEAKPLDAVADFLNGLALQKYPPTDNEWLPVIKIAELHRGVTEASDRASSAIEPRYIVRDGDVLFAWSGSLEVCIWCSGTGALNQHLFKVTSDRFPKWFFYLWIRHYLPEFQAIAADKATTMGHIQRHHLTQATVLVPPMELIEAMDKVISPLVERQITNRLESRTLAQIRNALLPKLLSGEVRVKNAEEVAAGVLA